MSSQTHQLSLLGRVIVNFVLAGLVLAGLHLLPEFPWKTPLAFCALALLCALAASIGLSPRTPASPEKPTRKSKGRTSTGSIKWFNATKGFGFITGDDGTEVFVHFRNVQGLSKRAIKQDQRVKYVVIQGDRGPQAEDVHPL